MARAWHHSEVGEGGIASTDAGHTSKNISEAVCFRDLLHFRSRIGNCDELASGLICADGFLRDFEEVLFEDVGFEGRARFARNHEECLCRIDLFLDCLDLRRIGRIEYVQLREACVLSVGERKNVGTQLDPPMPSNRMSVKAALLASSATFFR